jgi:hypothetical protein
MRQTPTTTRLSTGLLALLSSAALLSACGRNDERTAGQKLDDAIAKTEQKAGEVTADAKQAGRDVAADAKQAGRDVSKSVGEAADSAGSKSRDMAITAEIKASLARDAKLSALAINVDTSAGRVVLRGSAPDTAARSHATELARAVDGVVAVEYELSVQPRS